MVIDFKPVEITEQDKAQDLTPEVEGLPDPDLGFDPEAPYGRFNNGKARKHPPKGSGGSGTTRRSPAVKNEALARQAAEALGQINDIVVAGVYVLGLHQTASALAEANDPFKEKAALALVTDEKLCRSILKAGTSSGKISLGIAYLMLGASVGPVAIAEYREKRSDESRADG